MHKILIIGSSSEIGNAICRHAVASGYQVLGTSRKPCNEEIYLYPMDFKMHRDGKGANPREHR